jgi:hypothetical protein
MSNVTFSNNFFNDYLNTNVRFNVPNDKTKMENLLNQFHQRECILLSNLRKELDQNKDILKQDMINIVNKYEKNNEIIYQKYSGAINNLFAVLKNKSKEILDNDGL